MFEQHTFDNVGSGALSPSGGPLVGEVQVFRVLITGPLPVEFPTEVSLLVEGDHHVSIEDQRLSIPGGSIPAGEVQDLCEEPGSKADQPVSSTRVQGPVPGDRPVHPHGGNCRQEMPSGARVVAQDLDSGLTSRPGTPVPQTQAATNRWTASSGDWMSAITNTSRRSRNGHLPAAGLPSRIVGHWSALGSLLVQCSRLYENP